MVALVAGLVFLLLHTLIARKAMRFVLPALALLVVVVVVGLAAESPRSLLERWYRRAFVGVKLALLAWASFWFGNAGPVRAAAALDREPAVRGDLLVLDDDYTCLGEYCYLRRPEIRARSVKRAELASALADGAPGETQWLVAQVPLTAAELGPRHRLVEFGCFAGMLDLRKRERRWVYRIEPIVEVSPR